MNTAKTSTVAFVVVMLFAAVFTTGLLSSEDDLPITLRAQNFLGMAGDAQTGSGVEDDTRTTTRTVEAFVELTFSDEQEGSSVSEFTADQTIYGTISASSPIEACTDVGGPCDPEDDSIWISLPNDDWSLVDDDSSDVVLTSEFSSFPIHSEEDEFHASARLIADPSVMETVVFSISCPSGFEWDSSNNSCEEVEGSDPSDAFVELTFSDEQGGPSVSDFTIDQSIYGRITFSGSDEVEGCLSTIEYWDADCANNPDNWETLPYDGWSLDDGVWTREFQAGYFSVFTHKTGVRLVGDQEVSDSQTFSVEEPESCEPTICSGNSVGGQICSENTIYNCILDSDGCLASEFVEQCVDWEECVVTSADHPQTMACESALEIDIFYSDAPDGDATTNFLATDTIYGHITGAQGLEVQGCTETTGTEDCDDIWNDLGAHGWSEEDGVWRTELEDFPPESYTSFVRLTEHPLVTANTTFEIEASDACTPPYFAIYDYNNDDVLDEEDIDFLSSVVSGDNSCPSGYLGSSKVCDLTGDGTVDGLDIMRLTDLITCNYDCQPYYPQFDYNDDNILDEADAELLGAVVDGNQECPEGKVCDVNNDGTVDGLDITLLLDIINQEAEEDMPSEVCNDEIDNNCNWLVDEQDPYCVSNDCGSDQDCDAGHVCEQGVCTPEDDDSEPVCGDGTLIEGQDCDAGKPSVTIVGAELTSSDTESPISPEELTGPISVELESTGVYVGEESTPLGEVGVVVDLIEETLFVTINEESFEADIQSQNPHSFIATTQAEILLGEVSYDLELDFEIVFNPEFSVGNSCSDYDLGSGNVYCNPTDCELDTNLCEDDTPTGICGDGTLAQEQDCDVGIPELTLHLYDSPSGSAQTTFVALGQYDSTITVDDFNLIFDLDIDLVSMNAQFIWDDITEELPIQEEDTHTYTVSLANVDQAIDIADPYVTIEFTPEYQEQFIDACVEQGFDPTQELSCNPISCEASLGLCEETTPPPPTNNDYDGDGCIDYYDRFMWSYGVDETDCITAQDTTPPVCEDECQPDDNAFPYCSAGAYLTQCVMGSEGCYVIEETRCDTDEWCQDAPPDAQCAASGLCGDGSLDLLEECDVGTPMVNYTIESTALNEDGVISNIIMSAPGVYEGETTVPGLGTWNVTISLPENTLTARSGHSDESIGTLEQQDDYTYSTSLTILGAQVQLITTFDPVFAQGTSTCQDFGYEGGTLLCNPLTCGVDTSQCDDDTTPPECEVGTDCDSGICQEGVCLPPQTPCESYEECAPGVCVDDICVPEEPEAGVCGDGEIGTGQDCDVGAPTLTFNEERIILTSSGTSNFVNQYESEYYVYSLRLTMLTDELIVYPLGEAGAEQSVCPLYLEECKDGSYVGPNPYNNCDLLLCPEEIRELQGNAKNTLPDEQREQYEESQTSLYEQRERKIAGEEVEQPGNYCNPYLIECPDGSYVGPDHNNNCEVPECPGGARGLPLPEIVPVEGSGHEYTAVSGVITAPAKNLTLINIAFEPTFSDGMTCQALGFGAGELLCDPSSCQADTSLCEGGVPCDNDGECESGECSDAGVCEPTPCSGDDECESGECNDAGYCTPPYCGVDDDCDSGVCNPDTGVCIPPIPCGDDDECESGECSDAGVCEPTPCNEDDECESGACSESGVCIPPYCSGDDDCDSGVCDQDTGVCTPGTPPCESNNDCSGNEVCDLDTGACTAPPSTGTGPGGSGGGGGGGFFPQPEDNETEVVDSDLRPGCDPLTNPYCGPITMPETPTEDDILTLDVASSWDAEIFREGTFQATITNNANEALMVEAQLEIPNSWEYSGPESFELAAGASRTVEFGVIVGSGTQENVRVIFDAAAAGERFREQVDASITIPFFTVRAMPSFEEQTTIPVYLVINPQSQSESFQTEININTGRRTLYLELVTNINTDSTHIQRFDYPARNILGRDAIIEATLLEGGQEVSSSSERLD